MQVFRLVEVGLPDKVIAFNSLPDKMVQGIELGKPDGLPKHWHTFLPKVKRVIKGDYEKQLDGKIIRSPDIVDEKPCFYILEYKSINADMEKWQEICNFLRRTVEVNVRLLDKIENMAIPMAADSKSELTLEPEQVPIIPIPFEYQEKIVTGKEMPVETNGNDKEEHTKNCEPKGRWGKYSPEGECPRCDQLRRKLLVTA